MTLDLSASSGAIFSPCGRYRYLLWRRWTSLLYPEPRWFLFAGMNPSRADSIRSDPTVSQMRGRAERLGYNGLLVVNCQAFVSTDPQGLIGIEDPCGTENMAYIEAAASVADLIVAAWGNQPGEIGKRVESALRATGKPLHVLGITSNGSPRHPRGVPLTTTFQTWDPCQRP